MEAKLQKSKPRWAREGEGLGGGVKEVPGGGGVT